MEGTRSLLLNQAKDCAVRPLLYNEIVRTDINVNVTWQEHKSQDRPSGYGFLDVLALPVDVVVGLKTGVILRE